MGNLLSYYHSKDEEERSGNSDNEQQMVTDVESSDDEMVTNSDIIADDIVITSELTELPHGLPEPSLKIYGPEVDLHADVSCKKHQGHTDFIPVKKFSQKHLPDSCRKKNIAVNYIKMCAELTVHLQADYVSTKRPDNWADTDLDYPCQRSRGRSYPRAGSGFIEGVFKHGEGGIQTIGEKTCDCDICKVSRNPRKTWWYVEVRTAAHVVYDLEEARDTEVRFFFDENRRDSIVYKGHCLKLQDTEDDVCVLRVIVHEDVGLRLEKAHKYVSFSDARVDIEHMFGNVAAVISHPHGCAKQISVGRFVEKIKVRDKWYKNPLIHNASTCPGSSGGTVLVVGWWGCGMLGAGSPHSETLSGGRNRTCGWVYWS